jgi:ketosteroid isomerase-like protein
MSQENVELVRSICRDWERGDFSSIEWAHSDIEFVFRGGPSPGSVRGMTAMAEVWRDFLSAWDEWRQKATEYRDLDDERVLVFLHGSGRGKASGLDLGQFREEGANVFHVHDGKVTRIVIYTDRERALADLGLSE